jgi:predicted dehydrogenase
MNAVVVGFGGIGHVHAKALSEIKSVNLYGICDIDKERSESGAEEYGARAFFDYDECLKDENIEYVHICTPHYLHFEMIKKALDAGKKVVVEKPAVMKKEELQALYDGYDVKKIFPIVQNRAQRCIKELVKRTADEKACGKLLGVKGIVTWSRDKDYYTQDDWHGTMAKEGGGVLINQAIHALDLMVFFGGKAKEVSAAMGNFSLKDVIEVEDTLTAFIRFENGAKGVFFATNAYSKNSPVEIELHYEKVSFSYRNNKLYENGEYVCSDSDEWIGKKYWGNGHTITLHDLYENGSKMCLDDVKNTLDVVFAAYESANK